MTRKKYGCVVADPPWLDDQGMTGLEPYKIHDLPVTDAADKDAVAAIWCPIAIMREGMRALESWGFTYNYALPWIETKQPVTESPIPVPTRSEMLLFGYRGYMSLPSYELHNLACLITPGKKKPSKTTLYSLLHDRFPGPHLELFAKKNRPGWDAWGDPDLIETIDLYEGMRKTSRRDQEMDAMLDRIRYIWNVNARVRWETGDILNELARKYVPPYTKAEIRRLATAQMPQRSNSLSCQPLEKVAATYQTNERDYTVPWNNYYDRYLRLVRIRRKQRLDRRKKQEAERRAINEWIDRKFGFVDKRSKP